MRDPRTGSTWIVIGLVVAAASGCSDGESAHPWIDLGPDSAHRIIEYSGLDAGQVVIALDPGVTREEALALGERIEAQAPEGATVNVRLYNDEQTARNWRSAAANQRIEHLLVLVSSNSATGDVEVRWVRPDSLDAPRVISPGMLPGGTPPVDTPAAPPEETLEDAQ